MVRIATILLLSLLTCIGSDPRPFTFSDQAFLQVLTTDETTLGTNSLNGYPALSLYYPNTYVTNGGNTVSMTDAGPFAWHCTNSADANYWPTLTPNAVNGYPSLGFDGISNYINSVNYTSSLPHEIVMVCALTNQAVNNILFSGTSSTPYNQFYVFGSGFRLAIYAGSGSPTYFYSQTNKWMVVDCIFTGDANSSIYTNNVLAGSGDCGNLTMRGLNLGSARQHTFAFSKMAVALLVSYGGGNAIPGTNATARTQLYGILTNQFKLSL